MLKSLIEILSQLQCEYETCIVQVHKLYEKINYKHILYFILIMTLIES